jgi:uncharacterized membrane protein
MVTTDAAPEPSPNAPGTKEPAVKKSNGRRWLAIAFFVSLVVNLFLVGLILGRVLHPDFLFGGGVYAREFGPVAGRVIQHLIGRLDEADRQTVLNELKGHVDDFTGLNLNLRQERQNLIKLLRADKFDRKAVDDAFAELQRRNDALQQAMAAAIADAVQKLPASARTHLAE